MTTAATHFTPHTPRPRGLLGLAFRLPIGLYRLRLGWLLGYRFLLLSHRGRKSGKIRQTLLEVIHYDRATHESIVLSGWGARADWYRNIEANPALLVQTGRLRYRPRQRFLTREEAAAIAEEFVRAHPWEARLVPQIFRRLGWPVSEPSSRHGFPADVPFVAFHPQPADGEAAAENDPGA